MTTSTYVVIAACILMEALFSGAELALISATKLKLRLLAEGDSRQARMIRRFLDDPSELITASLVGTNICVVLSTVVTTLSLLKSYPHQAELISLAVMTPLVLVFGEILPKSIFQEYADQVAAKSIYALSVWRLVVYPFVAVGGWVSDALVRALGLQPQSGVMSREELGLLLRLPSREGQDRITADEKRMVTKIFDIKDRTVEQVMVYLSEVTALSAQATVDEAVQEIADKQHTRIPVFEERVDQIVGIVHAYDVLRAAPSAELATLARPPVYVPESQPALDTLVRLQRSGQGMAVVVDEYGGATGIVTIEDILEEIVGEIEDEFDEEEEEQIVVEPDGSFRIVAWAEVRMVNETLKINLPEGDDYESIGGLLLEQLKRIPARNDRITLDRVELLVTKATERAVEEVRLRVLKR